MTIKKACMVKSLKTDYLEIGKVILPVVVIAVVVYLGIMFDAQIKNYFTSIGAFQTFIASEVIALLALPIIFLCVDYIDPKFSVQMKDKETTPAFIIINSIILCVPYVIYEMMVISELSTFESYPDGTIIFLPLLIVNVLILSPLLIAYLRCKNE